MKLHKNLRVPVTKEEEAEVKELKKTSKSPSTLSAFYREVFLIGLERLRNDVEKI
jgi:hypothetical protein